MKNKRGKAIKTAVALLLVFAMGLALLLPALSSIAEAVSSAPKETAAADEEATASEAVPEGKEETEESEEDTLSVWALENAKEAVPDNVNDIAALNAVWDYMRESFSYDEGSGIEELKEKGKGNGEALMEAFDLIAESVPFTEDGLVDWEDGSDFLDVLCVEDGSRYLNAYYIGPQYEGDTGYRYYSVEEALTSERIHRFCTTAAEQGIDETTVTMF